jgi:hypothetical protein
VTALAQTSASLSAELRRRIAMDNAREFLGG